ncbi:unnamed protein product, partial [Ascophyllum nodosum]
RFVTFIGIPRGSPYETFPQSEIRNLDQDPVRSKSIFIYRQIKKNTNWSIHVHHVHHGRVNCSDYPAHSKHQQVRRHGLRAMALNSARNSQFGVLRNFRNSGRSVAP